MFKLIFPSFSSIGVKFPIRQISSTSCSITKIHRKIFARTYPTVMVLADGSSINIRYQEPRKIIKMPLDLSHLTDRERKERLEKRKPKKQVKIEEDIEDNYNAQKYIFRMKSQPKKT